MKTYQRSSKHPKAWAVLILCRTIRDRVDIDRARFDIDIPTDDFAFVLKRWGGKQESDHRLVPTETRFTLPDTLTTRGFTKCHANTMAMSTTNAKRTMLNI